MHTTAKWASLVLSRGGVWYWSVPADPGDAWPTTADAHTVFYDTTGATIADIYATDITTSLIVFTIDPSDVDPIPAGALFELFIDTDDGPFMIRTGKVVRREAQFFNAPATQSLSPTPFVDNLQRTALGSRWESVLGGTRMYDNSSSSLPFGMGPNVGLFSMKPSAVRYAYPLQGDSPSINVSLLNRNLGGKTTVVINADQNYNIGLGVQFDASANLMHIVEVTSPSTVVFQGSPVSLTLTHNVVENFTFSQNQLTNTLSVYQGTSTSPIAEFDDTTGLIPHGGGYRYTGFMFIPAGTILDSLTPPQVTGWQAIDSV